MTWRDGDIVTNGGEGVWHRSHGAWYRGGPWGQQTAWDSDIDREVASGNLRIERLKATVWV